MQTGSGGLGTGGAGSRKQHAMAGRLAAFSRFQAEYTQSSMSAGSSAAAVSSKQRTLRR
ncbi:hypothetical protein C2E21_3292 [Chlorella sorokiniana]|uniref:Uncharacterized protein n=1 Tax=Chlorella sorokiniana TaxID=3076 RepID=A0A2P6TX29_CHLSO|nr:hypothetical protein C2E21_3292 [Chlorella sorokiniana]|eukprot:PRW58619.1 hypothetical protein C2E21_3292 [Chlorella sorokiniana]